MHGRATIRALYAGSFDPPSVGHLDIIKRALASLCHHLTVAVAINPAKSCLFSIDERQQMLKKITTDLADVEVCAFDGLLVDFAMENNINLLVRGIRTNSDLEAELHMAHINRRLSGVETAFLLADSTHVHVSSSLIRELAHFGKVLPDFVPAAIAEDVYKKLGAPLRIVQLAEASE